MVAKVERVSCELLVALTAIWRWRSSPITHRRSASCLAHHKQHDVIFFPLLSKNSPQVGHEYRPLLLFLQLLTDFFRIDLFFFYAPLFPKGISTGHPFPCWAPQRSADTLSIISRHTAPSPFILCKPDNSTSAGRRLAGRLSPPPLDDLLYYYTSWQKGLVSV